MDDKPTSLQYKIAKVLVYNNIKKVLGLDQAKYMIFGAAPLAPDIR
jgi:long-chain-fatty-acid--CoA ligase ACSBG